MSSTGRGLVTIHRPLSLDKADTLVTSGVNTVTDATRRAPNVDVMLVEVADLLELVNQSSHDALKFTDVSIMDDETDIETVLGHQQVLSMSGFSTIVLSVSATN